MKRSALFTFALLMSAVLAFGQAVVTPSGQATTAGVAVPVVPYSPPLLVTPIVHLSTASTVPGATGGSVAAAEPPTAPGIRAEIQYGQPVVYMGGQPSPTEQATAPAMSAGAATGEAVFNSGVTANGGIASDNGLNGRSLGEVARELRQRMQNTNAKMYTNSDVTSMPNAGGITGTAMSVPPQQFPPNGAYPVAENGVIRQNGQQMNGGQAVAEPQNPSGNATSTQPATEQRNPFSPQQAEPANPATPATPGSNSQQPKPSAGTPPPPQISQAQVPPNPADQNAAAQQAQPQQEKPQKTLPKSASLLPLIALVGAAATVAGLMARK